MLPVLWSIQCPTLDQRRTAVFSFVNVLYPSSQDIIHNFSPHQESASVGPINLESRWASNSLTSKKYLDILLVTQLWGSNYIIFGKILQGKSSITDYPLKFSTLTVASGWNLSSRFGALLVAASFCLWWHHGSRKIYPTLHQCCSSYIITCIQEITTLQSPPINQYSPSKSSPEPGLEAMQVDSSRLSLAEHHRRLTQRHCLYCTS